MCKRCTPDCRTAAMMLSDRPGANGAALITASWPRSALASAAVSAASTATIFTPPEGETFSVLRAIAVTAWPRAVSSSRILVPIFPLAPMSATFICVSLRFTLFGEDRVVQQERQRRLELGIARLVGDGRHQRVAALLDAG